MSHGVRLYIRSGMREMGAGLGSMGVDKTSGVIWMGYEKGMDRQLSSSAPKGTFTTSQSVSLTP
jgi:hypothetical protein